MGSIDETVTETCEPAKSTSTPVVLSIDDDPLVSEVIQDRLDEYQIKLLSAYQGMQGLWMAITQRPDVIICDLRMPMGDGATIIECLKRDKKTAAIPIIVLTAKREEGLKHQMEKIGADSFLTKPIYFDNLLDELRRYIDVLKKV